MKLEYLYRNNKYIYNIIKKFTLAVFVIVFVMTIFLNVFEGFYKQYLLLIRLAIVKYTFGFDILFLLFGNIYNICKRKDFERIMTKGTCFEGIILSAKLVVTRNRGITITNKDSGFMTVLANNKTYTITDIDANEDFTFLRQKLRENKDEQIKIDIYVLKNEVVADLDSMKVL